MVFPPRALNRFRRISAIGVCLYSPQRLTVFILGGWKVTAISIVIPYSVDGMSFQWDTDKHR